MGRRLKTVKLYIRLLACVIAGFLTVGCINVKAEDSTGNYVWTRYLD
ncbi:MAG: hypothetical protein MJ131_08115 [Lachnospiraceae bacterium]|nr:hypothetical protein [Lachnospiraceae bacterium]